MKLDGTTIRLMIECSRRGVSFVWRDSLLVAVPPVYERIVYLTPWLAEQSVEMIESCTFAQLHEFGATDEATATNTQKHVFSTEHIVDTILTTVELRARLQGYLQYLPAVVKGAFSSTMYSISNLERMQRFIDNGWTVTLRSDYYVSIEVMMVTYRDLGLGCYRRSQSYTKRQLNIENYYMRDGAEPCAEDHRMFLEKHSTMRDEWLKRRVTIRYATVFYDESSPWIQPLNSDTSFLGRVASSEHCELACRLFHNESEFSVINY